MTTAKQKKAYNATCIGGGGVRPASEMLKFVAGEFVAGEDGQIYLDAAQKLSTPGAYLTPTRAAVDAAVQGGALAHSLGVAPLEDKQAFKAQMRAVLEKSFFARMGVARKAGHLVLGTRKAQQAAGEKTAQVVFMANDAGKDTRNTLEMMAQQNRIPLFYVGEKHQWAQVFHKENITVAAITDPRSAASLRFLSQSIDAFGDGNVVREAGAMS